jgi:hypothetical protein
MFQYQVKCGQHGTTFTFSGFDGYTPENVKHAWRVVVATVSGTQDLWVIDDPQGFKELQVYYNTDFGYGYARFTLLDPHCEQLPPEPPHSADCAPLTEPTE